jgi:hypothetical protein
MAEQGAQTGIIFFKSSDLKKKKKNLGSTCSY